MASLVPHGKFSERICDQNVEVHALQVADQFVAHVVVVKAAGDIVRVQEHACLFRSQLGFPT